MKNILVFLLLPFLSLTQQVELEAYSMNFETSYSDEELEYIDSAFNNSEIEIRIAKLLPHCPTPADCFESSAINSSYNWESSTADENFGIEYFRGIQLNLVDSSQILIKDIEEQKLLIENLLNYNQSKTKNEIIDICYNPRHIVIFRNKQGKIIAVQEICFECNHTKVGILTVEMRHNTSSKFRELFEKYNLLD